MFDVIHISSATRAGTVPNHDLLFHVIMLLVCAPPDNFAEFWGKYTDFEYTKIVGEACLLYVW